MNLSQRRILYYETLEVGLWGEWLRELAKDIAALEVLRVITTGGIMNITNNEILAAAANRGFTPKEVDIIKNALRNDPTGLIARLLAKQFELVTTNFPKPPNISWKPATEMGESKNEAKERKQNTIKRLERLNKSRV